MSSLLNSLLGSGIFTSYEDRRDNTPSLYGSNEQAAITGTGMSASSGTVVAFSSGGSGQILATSGAGELSWVTPNEPQQRNRPHAISPREHKCVRCGMTQEDILQLGQFTPCKPKIAGTTAHLLVVDDPAKPDDCTSMAEMYEMYPRLQEMINKRLSASLQVAFDTSRLSKQKKLLLLCGI